jgi:pyruvate/2-oxoglutarate dehydrogenase complex dihydrolipoamide acyltransferase (E2) component
VSSSPTEAAVAVTMPQMGVSVAEGTIVEWRKHVGEPIERDETICDISTDKIDIEVPAPSAGTVAEILVAAGATVAVGTTIARIDPGAPHNGTAHATADRGPRYSPVVARIAARHGIDLSTVKGSGRGGRVTKQDALAAIGAGSPPDAPAPLHIDSPYRPDDTPGAGEAVPLSRMRRSIADHMLTSLRTAATCTTVVEVDMSAVEAARAALQVTYLPFVARAAIDALRAHPALNATFSGDALTRHRDVNLGVAVSLGDDGLIVPVVHRAHELSVEGLAARIGELARRARAGELRPDEVRGGTFTITNPGAFGAIIGTPIINQPQVAILDLEAVVRRPVAIADGAGGEAVAIRPIANLCMSWDHRALDGALAAQFLSAVRASLERV